MPRNKMVWRIVLLSGLSACCAKLIHSSLREQSNENGHLSSLKTKLLFFPPPSKEISSVLPQCAVLFPAPDLFRGDAGRRWQLSPDIRCLHFSAEPRRLRFVPQNNRTSVYFSLSLSRSLFTLRGPFFGNENRLRLDPLHFKQLQGSSTEATAARDRGQALFLKGRRIENIRANLWVPSVTLVCVLNLTDQLSNGYVINVSTNFRECTLTVSVALIGRLCAFCHLLKTPAAFQWHTALC